MPMTIVIPHYELHDLLKGVCLLNLYLYSSLLEVIVIDNGSTESLALDGSYKVIRAESRLSFAEACNFGAREAKGDILIFLNNDCQVTPGWLAPIRDVFKDRTTVICGSKLLSPDGRIQHIGIEFGAKRVPYHAHLGEKDNGYKDTKDALAVTGACLAVRKDWFDSVGGFCEDFPGGNYEDVDLCLQARKQGKKIKIALDSRVIHLGGASYQIHPEEHTELLIRRNWEVLRKRWEKEPNKFFGITKKSPLLPREREWGL